MGDAKSHIDDLMSVVGCCHTGAACVQQLVAAVVVVVAVQHTRQIRAPHTSHVRMMSHTRASHI